MPFYEYQCAACGAHHEELQKVTDRALRKCPACGKASLKRLVSAPVFRLKGGGWYETDFKSDKDSQRNIAGEKEPATVEAKPEAGKDAKADAKAPGDAKTAGGPEAKPAADKPAAAKPAAAKGRSLAAKRRAQRRPASRPGRRR